MRLHSAVVEQLRGELTRARENPSPVYGLSTGVRSLDVRTRGLHAGEMTILAARSGHGKTALAGQIAYHVAQEAVASRREGVVLFFEAEMPATRLLAREVARRTGISVNRQLAAEYSPKEWGAMQTALDALSKLPMAVVDRASISPDSIREAAHGYANTTGLLMVVVDHLQLAVKRGGQRQYEATSETIHALRELRDVVDAPILVLSQLRRPSGTDDTRPNLHDLRDSGSIEEDANNVYALYCPPGVEDDDEESRKAELAILKARDGWTGTIHLQFQTERCSFVDVDHERDVATEMLRMQAQRHPEFVAGVALQQMRADEERQVIQHLEPPQVSRYVPVVPQ